MFDQTQFIANRRQVLRLAAAAGAMGLPLAGQTQSTWPTKPVNLVVPFPAGGGTIPLPVHLRHSLLSRPARPW